MITLPDPQHEKRVVDAIRAANEGDELTVRLGLLLDAGGGRGYEDLSELWEKGEWGQTELPITLDATIAGYLPNRMLDAHTRLIAEVEGVPIEQMAGRKTALDTPQDEYSTELLSSSAGSLATGPDAIKLRSFTEYPGWGPEQVVIDAASKLPYNQNRVTAQEIPGVHVNFVGSGEFPGFVAGEAVGAVFSRLGESQSIGYEFRDTNYGGMRAFVPRPLGSTTPDSPRGRHRTYASTQLPGWDLERPTPPKERYSEVRVFLNDRWGKLLFEEYAEIPYPPWLRRPHKNRFLNIAWEDTTDDGREGARQRATTEAARQGRLLLQGQELTLPAFDPLLESSDPLWITDVFRNYDGLYDASWRFEVKAYKHDFGNGASRASGSQRGSLNTVCAYEATLLSMEKVRAPDLIVPTAGYASLGGPS